jgi:hypothetical protein
MDGQNFKGLKVWQLGMILVEDILLSFKTIPEKRKLWSYQSDTTCRGFDTSEYC